MRGVMRTSSGWSMTVSPVTILMGVGSGDSLGGAAGMTAGERGLERLPRPVLRVADAAIESFSCRATI